MQGGFKNKIRNIILDTLLSDKKAFFTFFQKVAEHLGRTKSYSYSELFGAWAQTISYRPTVFESGFRFGFLRKIFIKKAICT